MPSRDEVLQGQHVVGAVVQARIRFTQVVAHMNFRTAFVVPFPPSPMDRDIFAVPLAPVSSFGYCAGD